MENRLYLSTTAGDALELAALYGCGIELAQFCYAGFLDERYAEFQEEVRFMQQVTKDMIYHAPFNEIYPAAIDPKFRRLALERLNQAYRSAASFGIKRMVIHSGYEPMVYFPDWYLSRATEFFREFMEDKPEDFRIMIENQMESAEDINLLPALAESIGDPRVGLTLDTGHAMYRGKDKPIGEWIRAYAPYATHIHLHHNDHSWDWHNTLDLPGAADVNVEEMVEQLLEEMPEATVTLEHVRAAGSCKWLEKKGLITRKDPALAENYAGYTGLANRIYEEMM